MNIYQSTKVLPYVYICTHKQTNRFYIGYREANTTPSTTDLPKYKTSSKIIKNNFDEYNWEIIAEFFNGSDAYDYEQALIFEHWLSPNLLNQQCQYGKARWKNNLRGKKLSAEHRKKLSTAKKGKKLPELTRQKMSAARQNVSKETTEKMSLAKLGKIFTEEHRKNISKSAKTRRSHVVSDETKEKLKVSTTAIWAARRAAKTRIALH